MTSPLKQTESNRRLMAPSLLLLTRLLHFCITFPDFTAAAQTPRMNLSSWPGNSWRVRAKFILFGGSGLRGRRAAPARFTQAWVYHLDLYACDPPQPVTVACPSDSAVCPGGDMAEPPGKKPKSSLPQCRAHPSSGASSRVRQNLPAAVEEALCGVSGLMWDGAYRLQALVGDTIYIYGRHTRPHEVCCGGHVPSGTTVRRSLICQRKCKTETLTLQYL